jgi:drug/metabolite transporter (DMT)-like permease
MLALAALLAVTAVWGVTFVQVKDAIALYPLFAFLAIRFTIATLTLAVPGTRRVRSLGRAGIGAGALLGLLLAAGYALQTAGLERTTVSSTGFVTGMYVVLTPLLALVLFRSRIAPAAWAGVGISTAGLALLSGVHAGSAGGDLLVLAGRRRLLAPDRADGAVRPALRRGRLHAGGDGRGLLRPPPRRPRPR